MNGPLAAPSRTLLHEGAAAAESAPATAHATREDGHQRHRIVAVPGMPPVGNTTVRRAAWETWLFAAPAEPA
ncbi:MAG: hypothetical protein IPG05_07480 [Gemmatimonadetes bacterium]|nr:hypothetical protein [Gemmatimonadota bacterium]